MLKKAKKPYFSFCEHNGHKKILQKKVEKKTKINLVIFFGFWTFFLSVFFKFQFCLYKIGPKNVFFQVFKPLSSQKTQKTLFFFVTIKNFSTFWLFFRVLDIVFCSYNIGLPKMTFFAFYFLTILKG